MHEVAFKPLIKFEQVENGIAKKDTEHIPKKSLRKKSPEVCKI
jgi:hypothetical protein